MKRITLSAQAAQRTATQLKQHLTPSDQSYLDALLKLVKENGRFNLGEALDELYPEKPRENALAYFRQLRSRINHAADSAKLAWSLEVEKTTRAAPHQRQGWFSGEDSAAEALADFSKYEASQVKQEDLIPQSAQEISTGSKTEIRCVISFDDKDRKEKEQLLKLLKVRLALSKDYRFHLWNKDDLLPGESKTMMDAEIQNAHFVLYLISPHFLSGMQMNIVQNVPHPIPVALKKIDVSPNTDLQGFEEIKIFYGSKNGNKKAFAEYSNDKGRDEFAQKLFYEIIALAQSQAIREKSAGADDQFHSKQASAFRDPISSLEAEQHRMLEEEFSNRKHVPNRCEPISLNKNKDRHKPASVKSGCDNNVLDLLDAWIKGPDTQAYCALLGETGMGKTTTCLALTHHLLKARQEDPTQPLPIYLDLRKLGEGAKQEPDLKAIIQTVLQKSWQSGATSPPCDAEEVIRLVREAGALIIFDGLDEVLNHLPGVAGQRFTRELFRILPPAWLQEHEHVSGRFMITCRSNFFRTLRDQTTHFIGEGREGIQPADYRALALLPFNESQIKQYLQQLLGEEKADHFFELMSSVHNLREIAERPLLLQLMSERIGEIERWKMEGRTVTGVMLYRDLVLSWLERDTGKHHLTPDHKQLLMEYLAAELWRAGRRLWSVGDVEQWLMDFLEARPDIAAHYTGKTDLNHREILKEDLRAATFLVREGEEDFRFAHTSLLEFFLASYLFRALKEGAPDDWQLPAVSPEILDFLGQLNKEEGSNKRIQDNINATLRRLRESYQPQASELAFTYCLHAYQQGYPAIALAGFCLQGAKLRGLTVEGKDNEPRLNLRGIVLSNAFLEDSCFRHVNLDQSDFRGAHLERSEFHDFRAIAAQFSESHLAGTIFRCGHLNDADFKSAHCHRTQWLKCDLTDARHLPEDAPTGFFALSQGGLEKEQALLSRSERRLAVLDGHKSGVTACAFSPDGQRLVSASGDCTLRLWDSETGECRAVLSGHEAEVRDCAFSPDGQRLASASWDGTLRLWDSETGECLAVLPGHEFGVSACAFSPDGQRLASASGDCTLRLWDSETGDYLAKLDGHKEMIWGCAFSPNGQRLASASDDDTLHLWDSDTRECLAVLSGHESGVLDCAFSPDGRRLASASRDGTLRLWDSVTGECLNVLSGHKSDVRGCAFSPDGRRLASASRDGTLRLWDSETGDCLAVLSGHEGLIWCCAFSPDGRRLASASEDRTLRVRDSETGECLVVLSGHEVGVLACAFSPNGQRLVLALRDRTLSLWSGEAGECLTVLSGHENIAWGYAFAPDGQRLASASLDGTLRLWDCDTGECLAMLSGHNGGVLACAFSLDGRRLASASWDRTLRLWDSETGKCLAVLPGHNDEVLACTFSKDGQRLISFAQDDTVRLWDSATGECLAVLSGQNARVLACAFSPDGQRLASVSLDGALRLRDSETGECLAVLSDREARVLACTFSPDGQRLVSASRDGILCLWDVNSGERLSIFRGHEAEVWSCAFSPEGYLASASHDGSLRLWDIQNAKELRRIQFFEEGSWASLDIEHNRVIQISGDAWRWLRWRMPNPKTGKPECYPVEIFGPLPEFETQ